MTQPLLSSFSVDCLIQLKTLSSKYPLVLLLHEYRPDWIQLCQQLNCLTLHVNYHVLTDAWMKEIKQAEMTLRAFTVNDLPIAEKLFHQGIDGIITDFPDRMSKYL